MRNYKYLFYNYELLATLSEKFGNMYYLFIMEKYIDDDNNIDQILSSLKREI
jgi:hypothetical protein